MSKREDIETLRRWARENQSGTGWFDRNNVVQAVRRLFSGNGDPLIAGSDLAALRLELDKAPMSHKQRVRVNRRLGKLQSAMETETREPDEGERAAVRAIETLSRYLGGIDELWHNYQLAARIGKDACKAMMRIRAACPTYDTSKGSWADAEEQAVMALSKLKDHARIIEIKERWWQEAAEEKDASKRRDAVVQIFAALAPAVIKANPLLEAAFREILSTLNHLHDDEIPF
jgi:hypothetical protein